MSLSTHAHTTYQYNGSSRYVTITHPQHPLHNQQVAIQVRMVRLGEERFVIRIPGSRETQLILARYTDFGEQENRIVYGEEVRLLDLDCLRKLADLVASSKA